jgi:hypothetical protein
MQRAKAGFAARERTGGATRPRVAEDRVAAEQGGVVVVVVPGSAAAEDSG